MKILITGSSGLVGTELKTCLMRAGHHVFSLVHIDNKRSSKKDLTWSIKNKTVNLDSKMDFDVVVHLAGANIAKPWTMSHKKEILSSREDGTKLLVEKLLESPLRFKHFISTSAIGIYPDPSNQSYDETGIHGTGFLSEVCEKWEAALQPLYESHIPTSVVRVGLVLSTQGGVFPVASKTRKWGIVPLTGSGSNVWSWIHLRDLVRIYQFLIEGKLTQGTYNAVAPQSVTQKDFAEIMLQKTQARNQQILPMRFYPTVPGALLKLLLGERSQLALTSQCIVSSKLSSFPFDFPSIDLAMEDLIHG
jgi:uncharacterized protein (TIGR01777 family)